MTLGNQTTSAASVARPLPTRNTGTMNAEVFADKGRPSQHRYDGASWFHSSECSDFRNTHKGNVAKWEREAVALRRYSFFMFSLWVKDALSHARMSGAELSRLLSARLGRSIDRAAVSKMQLTAATAKTKPRAVAADEMMAISDITGFPLPAEFGAISITAIPKISWVSAGHMQAADGITDLSHAKYINVADLPAGDWIALDVEGDSMDRISPPGSVIVVNMRDKRLVPNACYVFSTENGEASYKRYRPDPDRFEPVSNNLMHEALFPEGPVHIVGRVRKSMIEM